jgi:hypothetical protein
MLLALVTAPSARNWRSDVRRGKFTRFSFIDTKFKGISFGRQAE